MTNTLLWFFEESDNTNEAQYREMYLWCKSWHIFGLLSDGKGHRSKLGQMWGSNANGHTHLKERNNESEWNDDKFQQIHIEVGARHPPFLQEIEEGSPVWIETWVLTSVHCLIIVHIHSISPFPTHVEEPIFLYLVFSKEEVSVVLVRELGSQQTLAISSPRPWSDQKYGIRR